MKLNKKVFYIIPLLVFLFLDELFVPYPYGIEGVGRPYREIIDLVRKLLPFLALGYILVNLIKQSRFYFWFFLIPVLYFVFLVFESLYLYNSFFEFPHVGLKIMDLIIAIALFIFYRNRDTKYLHLTMDVILIMLILKIAIHPSMLSTEAFVSHERGVPSSTAYLLLLPCLYYFNSYIVDYKQLSLIKFLIFLGMIFFFQHRTVWVATLVTFLFNIYILKKQKQFKFDKAFFGILPIGFFLIFTSSIVLTYLPDMVGKIGQNIEDIFNPTDESTTSSWRLQQFESYMPYVLDHPVEGMRLKGFELPVQFYQPGSDNLRFQNNSGHHFHSFYFDILFYFGAIGLLIFLWFMLRPILLTLLRNLNIDYRQLSFVAFTFSGFIYGLSYVLPVFCYAILGLSLAIVEKGSNTKKNESI